MDFIAIPSSVKPSNAPTPKRPEPSPAPSQGGATPSFNAGASFTTTTTSIQSAPGIGGSTLNVPFSSTTSSSTLLDMEEDLRRSGTAVEALQQMDLWSLVLDLITRIQHGTVTAKTVDNEAGIIRARIAKAKQSLRQVSGLDISIGEREEEIIRLQDAIEKKKDLLLRFQAVMGAAASPQASEVAPTIIKQEPLEPVKPLDPSQNQLDESNKQKEESLDPITDIELKVEEPSTTVDDPTAPTADNQFPSQDNNLDEFMSDFGFMENNTATDTNSNINTDDKDEFNFLASDPNASSLNTNMPQPGISVPTQTDGTQNDINIDDLDFNIMDIPPQGQNSGPSGSKDQSDAFGDNNDLLYNLSLDNFDMNM